MKNKHLSLLLLLIWILTPALLTAQSQNSVQGDRQALVDLYNSTNGDNWKNKSGWLNGNPSNSWHGVQVDGNGRVTSLNLRNNNLKGNLPSTLGNLSRTTYFNVKQNELSGSIPSSIGNMTSLRYLLLNGQNDDPVHDKDQHPGKEAGTGTEERSNNFTGPIPSSIGKLSNLLFFEATGKNINVEGLRGPIPAEIGNLTNLIGLHLDYNDLTSVPSSLGNLTKLVHLGLSVNKLSGGIPSTIGNLVSLRYFRIGKNGIGGTIPDFGHLKELRIFSSTFNNLTGSIPSSLTDGTLRHINLVSLAHNNLSGTLSEFGNTNLAMFTVDNNNLEGTIPSSISSQRRMTNLGLSFNNFEGGIPDLSQMHQLRYVRVNHNNFTGSLPMVDTDNTKLQHFYYQNNNMSGYIIPALADVVDLPVFQTFNISRNKFSDADLKDFKTALSAKGKLSLLNSGGQSPSDDGGSSGGNDDGSGPEDEGSGEGDDNDKEPAVVLPAPSRIAPSHHETGVSLKPVIEWSDVDADYYILHANRLDPAAMAIEEVVYGTSFSPETALDPETRHHWRVKGVKDGVEGEWSTIGEFTTTGVPQDPGEDDDDQGSAGGDGKADDEGGDESSDEGNETEEPGSDGDETEGGDTSEPIEDKDDGSGPEDEGSGDTESGTDTDKENEDADESSDDKDDESGGAADDEEEEEEEIAEEKQRGKSNPNERAAMRQNYPNPFNPSTQIQFSVNQPQQVSLRVYNMAGRLVATLFEGPVAPGSHHATFNADNLASGIYFYRLITEHEVITRQMTFLK